MAIEDVVYIPNERLSNFRNRLQLLPWDFKIAPTVNGVPIGGSSGSKLGSSLAYASPAGVIAAAPVGFTSATGRLIVSLAGGNSTWSTLTAGTDGQLCLIVNEDPTNTLTLPAATWGGAADLLLPPKARVLAYYDGSAGTPNWKVTG